MLQKSVDTLSHFFLSFFGIFLRLGKYRDCLWLKAIIIKVHLHMQFYSETFYCVYVVYWLSRGQSKFALPYKWTFKQEVKKWNDEQEMMKQEMIKQEMMKQKWKIGNDEIEMKNRKWWKKKSWNRKWWTGNDKQETYISKVSKIDCLRFVMCPLLAPALQG